MPDACMIMHELLCRQVASCMQCNIMHETCMNMQGFFPWVPPAVTPPAVTPRLPEAAHADGTKGGVIRRGIIRITAHWGLPSLPSPTLHRGRKRGGYAKVNILPIRGIRVQTFPAMLQSICQLFPTFGPVAALKYDKLFRQAVARAKDQTIRWDNLKEDLLVWCATNPPF